MYSILLVDDDLAVRKAIGRNLEQAGYAVAYAADGLEAEAILCREGVDVLLTDILMPNRDGLELISVVRGKFPAVRIIAMSGGGRMTADMCLQIAQGFQVDGLLAKPFSFDELFSLLRALLARAAKTYEPVKIQLSLAGRTLAGGLTPGSLSHKRRQAL